MSCGWPRAGLGVSFSPVERCLTNAEQFAKVIDAPPKP